MHFQTSVSVLALLSWLSGSALAAQCYTDKTAGDDGTYWALRQEMCANERCGYQQECFIQSNGVAIRRLNRGSQPGFPNCWDATENIINQCVRGQNNGGGDWVTDEEYYQFYRP